MIIRTTDNSIILLVITVLCPPIGLALALYYLYCNNENWKACIFCIAYALGVFAYCYESTTNSDLLRYFQYANSLSRLSFSEALNMDFHGDSNLFTFNALCWLTSNLGDVRLLPAISTFSVYYIGLYVTCRLGSDFNLDAKSNFQYLFIILFSISFVSIVENVRNIWAFSMIGLGVFRDLYLGRRNLFTFFLYIFPIFMHTSAILILALRIVVILPNRMKYIFAFLCLFLPVFLSLLSVALSGIKSGNILIDLFIDAINSGNKYFETTDSEWAIIVAKSGSQKLFKIIYMAIATVLVIMYIKVMRDFRYRNAVLFSDVIHKKVIDFPFFACVLTFSCLTMVMPEYWRFVSIAILFSGSIFFNFSISYHNSILVRLLELLSSLVFVLWMRNLFVTSDVPVMFLRSCITNPISILSFRVLGISIDAIF